MPALVPTLDLRDALQRTRERGAAHVARALDGTFRARLRREVEAGSFRAFRERFGKVRQQIEGYDVNEPFDGFPLLAELRDELTGVVREHGAGIRGLATWRPNEVGVAGYRAGSIGITPHLDGRWYRRLVAVVTLHGRCRFVVCRTRDPGDLLEDWTAGPGDLVLLRGPGLAGVRDGRPFHAVIGPVRGERVSLGFRMSVGSETPR